MIEVDEPTSRIERDELLGLLNTTTRPENQRITARIPVVTLNELLQPGNDQAPPAEVVVRFRQPAHPLLMISEYGWAMMVASVLATVTFGVAAMITLW
jgi:hypothetical protein